MHWPQQPCGFLTWLKMWCHQLCLKKISQKPSKAHKVKVTVTFLKEQSIQVLAHSPYSPNLTPCDFWLFPLIKERLAGPKFPRIQDSGPHKGIKFEAPCIVSILLSKWLWILAQTTGTLCAKRRRVFWRNVNVVGKSDRHFLFDGPSDITEWTAIADFTLYLLSSSANSVR